MIKEHLLHLIKGNDGARLKEAYSVIFLIKLKTELTSSRPSLCLLVVIVHFVLGIETAALDVNEELGPKLHIKIFFIVTHLAMTLPSVFIHFKKI